MPPLTYRCTYCQTTFDSTDARFVMDEAYCPICLAQGEWRLATRWFPPTRKHVTTTKETTTSITTRLCPDCETRLVYLADRERQCLFCLHCGYYTDI